MALDRKILVVFGATGAQGGSVAKAMLEDPVTAQQFKIRAITRDPSKPAATALAELGAEVVQGDLEDKISLRLALKDAYAVYAVTTYMESMVDATGETRQGKNIADISKELDIKHLIWSSLPNVTRITNGKITGVTHYDSKAQVDDYIRSLSIPYTIINVATYTSFLVSFLVPLQTTPQSYGLFLPEPANLNTKMPMIDVSADLGKFVKAILMNPEKSLNHGYDIAEKLYTIEEVINILKRLGLDVNFQAIGKEAFKAGLASKGLPEFLQEGLVQAVEFIEEYGPMNEEAIEEGHKLVTEPLTSLEDSLKNSATFAELKE